MCCDNCRRPAQSAPCTCGQMWMSILPPPPCPSHGAHYSYVVTNTTATAYKEN